MLPLIDLAGAFARICRDETCEELVRDQHPNASGHRVAAEILSERLAELPLGPRRVEAAR